MCVSVCVINVHSHTYKIPTLTHSTLIKLKNKKSSVIEIQLLAMSEKWNIYYEYVQYIRPHELTRLKVMRSKHSHPHTHTLTIATAMTITVAKLHPQKVFSLSTIFRMNAIMCCNSIEPNDMQQTKKKGNRI